MKATETSRTKLIAFSFSRLKALPAAPAEIAEILTQEGKAEDQKIGA
jgi:hypothetical protein